MNSNKKAFTLLELMVSMGIIMILIALGLIGIFALQKRARDTDRVKTLGEIVNQVNNYKRANLKYPAETEVLFKNSEIVISEDRFKVSLKGSAQSGNDTSRTSTRYYYSKTDKGFALCALLESGKIENAGNSECPQNINNW